MRAVVQRVSQAQVAVGDEIVAQIGHGALVLLGVGRNDDAATAHALAQRIVGLRIFDDQEGRMNRSLRDVEGEMLVVSQFTLWGDTSAGRRPSWSRAAPGSEAEPLYRELVAAVRGLGVKVCEGRFGATMRVSLVNQGPVTLLVDTDGKF